MISSTRCVKMLSLISMFPFVSLFFAHSISLWTLWCHNHSVVNAHSNYRWNFPQPWRCLKLPQLFFFEVWRISVLISPVEAICIIWAQYFIPPFTPVSTDGHLLGPVTGQDGFNQAKSQEFNTEIVRRYFFSLLLALKMQTSNMSVSHFTNMRPTWDHERFSHVLHQSRSKCCLILWQHTNRVKQQSQWVRVTDFAVLVQVHTVIRNRVVFKLGFLSLINYHKEVFFKLFKIFCLCHKMRFFFFFFFKYTFCSSFKFSPEIQLLCSLGMIQIQKGWGFRRDRHNRHMALY